MEVYHQFLHYMYIELVFIVDLWDQNWDGFAYKFSKKTRTLSNCIWKVEITTTDIESALQGLNWVLLFIFIFLFNSSFGII